MDAKAADLPTPRFVPLPSRGGEMAVLDFGPAERPVDVVFSHANGFNGRTYRSILQPLAGEMRILALDRWSAVSLATTAPSPVQGEPSRPPPLLRSIARLLEIAGVDLVEARRGKVDADQLGFRGEQTGDLGPHVALAGDPVALAVGCRVESLHLHDPGERGEPPTRLRRTLEQAFEMGMVHQIRRDVELARYKYPDVDVQLVAPSAPLELRPLDFDAAGIAAALERGRADASRCLDVWRPQRR